MIKNISVMHPMMSVALLSMGISTAYAVAPFDIAPITPTRVVVPTTGTVSVQYTVTNRGPANWLAMENIPGVSVNPTGINACGNPFYLLTGQSCTLNLRVSSSVVPTTLGIAPKVCQTKADHRTPSQFMCNTPFPANALQVSTAPLPSRQLVAVGSLYNGHQYPTSNSSTTAGFSWSMSYLLDLPISLVNTQGYLNAVSCDSTGLKCVAVGSNESVPLSFSPPGLGIGITYTTTNGGVEWSLSGTQPTPPAGATAVGLYAVNCNSNGTLCTAVGFYVDAAQNYLNLAYYSLDGGSTWTQSTLPPLDPAIYTFNSLNSVSCDATGMNCTAVGAGNNLTQGVSYSVHSTDGGKTWGSAYTVLSGPVAPAGTLASSIFCDAATGLKCAMISSVSGPTTQQLVFSTLYPTSYTTTDGGATWNGPVNLLTIPTATNNSGSSVACDSTVTHCIATGGGSLPSKINLPLVYSSNDGGNSWSAPIILTALEGSTGSASIGNLSCTATGLLCTGVGRATINGVSVNIAYTTFDGGKSWSSPTIVPNSAGGNVIDPNAAFVGVNSLAGSQ
ncbi:Neuraminidase (sialidase) [Legionella massiliensis]|uniref:Neuraminidase (Sialidase) n=1 Tax=Legionella massiliensis TaxID=1034943 RepID=A0A078KUL5_9GAMM|nr:sialidase family protein [Legionella massiliensis]CDZ78150.1 Neuraminidase (sialidase) [Legionella massiliensis]CEE13888.1 BNR/Asp-box repeat protein [Legionella massiliensis]